MNSILKINLFLFNKRRCYDCLSGCIECLGFTDCLSCANGRYLNSGSCYYCMENCIICTNSTNCDECDFGYTFRNGSC